MNKTANYNLNQWEKSDRVLMEDFNSDNAKIDAAIAETREAIPRIAFGSYVGTGTSGSENPNSLSFDFHPTLVLVFCPTGQNANAICFAGSDGTVYSFLLNNAIYTRWEDKTLVWHSGRNADEQFNAERQTYIYFAI